MIKFRCKTYSTKLAKLIYGGKKVMQAVDNAGLKVGKKLKGYITHKPPTVEDNILLRKSKTQMAREAIAADVKIRASMYEPEEVIANYIGDKIVEPMVHAPGTTLLAAANPIPGVFESGIPAKVGKYEARIHRTIQDAVANKLGKKELLDRLIERREKLKNGVKKRIKPIIGTIGTYLTYL